jgi:hypothetical protein
MQAFELSRCAFEHQRGGGIALRLRQRNIGTDLYR